MRKIAVIGVGAIGGLLGAYLTHGGQDVTIISCFRRENAHYMNEHGMSVDGARGSFSTPVHSVFIDDLTEADQFDVFMLALKCNDTENVLLKLSKNLKPDGYALSLQNGLQEELMERILGNKRVVYAVSRAGGALVAPGRVCDHDGEFVIGEKDNRHTPRILELQSILSHARPTVIAENIMEIKWDKLSTVALAVPTAAISGIYLSDVFYDANAQRLFGLLAVELFQVAAANGVTLTQIKDRTLPEWVSIASGNKNGVYDRETMPRHIPAKVVDAYTQDIKRGRPLEIDFINGEIVRLGKRTNVPTIANEAVLSAVHRLESGEALASLDLLESVIAKITSGIKE